MGGRLQELKTIIVLGGLLPFWIASCTPLVSTQHDAEQRDTQDDQTIVFESQPRIDPYTIRPVITVKIRGDPRLSKPAELPDITHKTPSAISLDYAITRSEATANPVTETLDIWEYLRGGFQLPDLDNKYVRQFERAYAQQPDLLLNMLQRARRYLPYIAGQVERRALPMEIALLPAVESAFKPDAYSKSHATGLWQFIPATGKRYGLKQSWWYDGRRDIVQSTRAALDYLEFLGQEFKGDWLLALPGYNAGENRIHRALRDNKNQNKPLDYNHLKLSGETRRYLPKLIALRNIINNPAKYGITLPPMQKAPYFVEVDTGFQIDLGVVATIANVPEKEIHALNPGLRRWATVPGSSHRVLVPASAYPRFIAGLRSVAPDQRVVWTRHKVANGDVLGSIARRYNVDIGAIRAANRLQGDLIRLGQELAIPGSTILEEQVASLTSKTSLSNPVIIKHHVGSGDTLWIIARRYGVLVSELAKWNNIQISGVLKLEQRLTIYPKSY